jgi:hypothetical protein
MPVAARRQLNDLPDELWTKINIEFYIRHTDARAVTRRAHGAAPETTRDSSTENIATRAEN